MKSRLLVVCFLAMSLWFAPQFVFAGTLTTAQKKWIVQRLQSARSPKVLFQAIGWAGREGIHAARPAIRKHLFSKDARVAQSATIAAGRLRDGKAVPGLLKLLAGHKSTRVRVAAAWSLSRMRVKSAIPVMRKRLQRSYGFEQNTLLWALTHYRSQALVGLFKKMMLKSGEKCQIVAKTLRSLKALSGKTRCWSSRWRRSLKARWKM